MGAKILVDDERMPKELAKNAKEELVRFRTLGCYPLTGAINSSTSNVLEIIEELLLSKTSERQCRLIDTDEEASMEKKKKEGVFLIKMNGEKYLKEHENQELCRFIIYGSVDDGKSTLIGRMLYDAKMLFEDQILSLEKDSKKLGNAGEKLDFALLVDGLASERARYNHRCSI